MLSPLLLEPVAFNYGCDANHDIPLAIVTRPTKVCLFTLVHPHACYFPLVL
ncbi:hypothetical protein SLEP1_g4932 [Rubroshorea leprosula]|uniref:Uncharacterized protein n=1 Tax=Rubroshorea leprosula TaxID=152421 RepID=A0AAV5HUL7_9ROSI|nr:hypothetical protein SLEP1_g4932 [Rubroshorea leprosula]